MLLTYLKISIRNLLKLQVLTILTIISLALAMLSVMLIALWVKDELSYDRKSKYSERLYRLTVSVNDPEHGLHSNFARCYQAWPNALKSEFPEIEEVTRLSAIQDNIIKLKDDKFNVRFHQVDTSFFRIFDIPLVIGSSSTVFAQEHNIVLSESMARKLFGSSDPMGKSIQMYCLNCSEKTEYHITGIMKDIPGNSHFHMDLAGPIAPPDNYTEWAYYYFLLKENVKPDELLQKLPAFFRKNKMEDELKISKISLQSVRDIHLNSSKDRELDDNGSMTGIWVFIGIAIFVLSVSLINFFNLRFAGSISSIKTAQIMRVFGATGKDIIFQVVIELLIIVGLAVLISILAAESIIPAYNNFTGKYIRLSSSETIFFSLKLAAILICLSLLAGLYPAFILLVRTKLNSTVSGGRNFSSAIFKKGNKPTLMKNLIVLQFVAAILLMSGSMAIYRQNQYLLSKRLGSHESNILCVRHLPVQVVDKYLYFREQLLKNPLVKDVTSTFEDPADEALDKFKFETTGISDQAKDKFLYVYPAADNIFSFYNIPFISGSNFPLYSGNDSLPESYILNEAAIETLGWKAEEAVGKNFRLIFMLGDKNLFRGGKIIGVVKNFHTGSAKHNIEPMVYFQKKFWQFSCQVRMDSSKEKESIAFVKATWNAVYSDYPFDYVYVDDLYNKIYRQELRQQKLLSIFTLIAILISCMGLWSISSLITRQRTKEIGIRKVNGASLRNILFIMNSEFISLVLIAFIISLPISWFIINRWLQNFPNHININAWIFISGGLVALLSALITVSWQSFRAARLNPVKALRYE